MPELDYAQDPTPGAAGAVTSSGVALPWIENTFLAECVVGVLKASNAEPIASCTVEGSMDGSTPIVVGSLVTADLTHFLDADLSAVGGFPFIIYGKAYGAPIPFRFLRLKPVASDVTVTGVTQDIFIQHRQTAIG